MDWNDLFKSIKNGEFQNVYLFTGPEELTKREALEALRRALLPVGLEALNEVRLENVGAQAIIDAAVTMPVMCDRRLVIVRDWPLLAKGKAKAEESDTALFLEWMAHAPDSCCIVFYMAQETDGRKKLVTALKKLDGYVNFDRLSGATLDKWCAQQLKPYKKKISRQALDELTLMAGTDLTKLSGELKKLADYSGDATEISIADVRRIVSPSPEYSVFTILDHLLGGNLPQAVRVTEGLIQNGSKPMQLISMLSGQLRFDAHVKLADDARMPLPPEAAKRCNLSTGKLYYIRKQIKNVSASELQKRYLRCTEIENEVKSGHLRDKAALDALMLDLLRKK